MNLEASKARPKIMANKVIIHCGWPKTGTTYLQKYIFPFLGERFAYNPAILKSLLVEMCKEIVAKGELSPTSRQAIKRAVNLDAQARHPDQTLLLSIESFLPIQYGCEDLIDRIIHSLHGFYPKATMVMVGRDSYSWSLSSYSFMIKSGYLTPAKVYYNISSDEDLNEDSRASLNYKLVDMQLIEAKIRKYYKDVVVLRYEDLFNTNCSSLSALLSILGNPEIPIRSRGKVNSSLDPCLIRIISKICEIFLVRKAWPLRYLYPNYASLSLKQRMFYYGMRIRCILVYYLSVVIRYTFFVRQTCSVLPESQKIKIIRKFEGVSK